MFIKFIASSIRRTFIAKKLNKYDKKLEELYTELGLKYYNGEGKRELKLIVKEIDEQKELIFSTYKKISKPEKKYLMYADRVKKM